MPTLRSPASQRKPHQQRSRKDSLLPESTLRSLLVDVEEAGEQRSPADIADSKPEYGKRGSSLRKAVYNRITIDFRGGH
jgi:hypothetical protein